MIVSKIILCPLSQHSETSDKCWNLLSFVSLQGYVLFHNLPRKKKKGEDIYMSYKTYNEYGMKLRVSVSVFQGGCLK